MWYNTIIIIQVCVFNTVWYAKYGYHEYYQAQHKTDKYVTVVHNMHLDMHVDTYIADTYQTELMWHKDQVGGQGVSYCG